jgi:hypothetical protein
MTNYRTFIYNIEDENKLSVDKLNNSINEFWKEHTISNKHFSLIYRVVFYKNNRRITLLKRKSFTYDDKELFQGLVANIFTYSENETLKNSIVKKIIIKYKILETQKENKISKNFKLQSYKLPMTMDLNVWGNIYSFDDNNIQIIKKKNSNSIFRVVKNNLANNIELKDINNKILIKFTDIRNEGDPLNTFVRIYDNNYYYIYRGNRFFKLNTIQN